MSNVLKVNILNILYPAYKNFPFAFSGFFKFILFILCWGVGDIVTIVLSESINFNDSLNYTSDRSSNTVDNFTNFINKILPGTPLNNQFNNFGGSNSVESTTANNRTMGINDSVTVQVVQMLPNGNLI